MNIQSINPASGQVIKNFSPSSVIEIDHAVKISREAQKLWNALSNDKRIDKFQSLKKVLSSKTSVILSLIKEETGKLMPDGEAEVFDVIDAVDYYSQQLKKVKPLISQSLNNQAFPDTDLIIDYVPYGVMGLIMPWNFSFYSPMMFIIASLMAGNAVVLKPSEYSTLIGLEIQKMFEEAGFPKHLVEVIIGDEEAGKALVKSSVDKLFFVGSVEAGQDILKNAGVKPVQVELGGNSAAIILDDANVDLAVQGVAWGATYHSGQDCVGIKRVFVVKNIAEEFMSKLVGVVKGLRLGVDYGPYIRHEQIDTVKTRIQSAIVQGAQLICGGEEPDQPGNWLTPSVIVYKDETLELVSKETFGNVIPVMIVENEEEAIAKANNTEYGLSTCIFTNDLTRSTELAARFESGMVFINDPFIAIPGWDHWTGWKQSGLGTVESKLMQCFKKKVVSINRSNNKRSFWYPYNT